LGVGNRAGKRPAQAFPTLPTPQLGFRHHFDLSPLAVSFDPEPLLLRSDLLGLSKHIPVQISKLKSATFRHSIKPEALDVSASQLKEEVVHALKAKLSTNGWHAGVVVEYAVDGRPTSRNGRKELEIDINWRRARHMLLTRPGSSNCFGRPFTSGISRTIGVPDIASTHISRAFTSRYPLIGLIDRL